MFGDDRLVVEELEVVLLLLGIFVLVFIMMNKRLTKELPYSTLLISAFLMFLVSWTFTNIESFFSQHIFNILEHGFQLLGAVLIFVWCWKLFMSKEVKDASHSND